MDETDSFGSLAGRLGFQLHWADVRAMTALSALLAPLGVTPARATATVYIGRHAGCDQMALGRALGINRASTMKAVNELVALGVVERRPGRDRRSNALHLTGAGEAMRHEIERITTRHDATAFAALTAGERSELIRLLAKVRDGRARAPAAGVPAPRLQSVN